MEMEGTAEHERNPRGGRTNVVRLRILGNLAMAPAESVAIVCPSLQHQRNRKEGHSIRPEVTVSDEFGLATEMDC